MNTQKPNLVHLFRRGFRGICRIAANHCLIPSLRHSMLRLSGLVIGKDTFVNMGITAIDDYEPGEVILGDRVAIAPNVTFVTRSYPNNSRLKDRKSLLRHGRIEVHDDAWLGTGVVVMPDVTIGTCAIVGANSLVTKDVEPYAIVVGNPARKIGDVRDRS